MTIFDFDDYRKYLAVVLETKRSRNPAFSMRAFAKFLGISSSGLSEVLQGKTNLSAEQTGKIGQRLGLKRLELDYFCSLVLYSQTNNDLVKSSLRTNLQNISLGAQANPNFALFRTLVAWYSAAVQEYSQAPSTKINSNNSDEGIARLMEFHKMLIAMVLMLPAISDAQAADVPDLTGLYDCPAYKAADNEWKAHQLRLTQNTLGGVPIIISQTMGLPDKTGPYNIDVEIADGEWRFTPFYRNKILYPMKVKTWVKDKKIHWESDIPAYVDNQGNKKEAKKGFGSQWLDADKNLISVASHYTGEYKCKRRLEK